MLVAARQPLTKLQLDRYRGVIIQDVPADQFGFVKMSRLAQFVTERGGGLLLTGGENSFGSGGYFKSPLDDVLPVSMELREEHRKLRAAIAVVLDRSGSMQARVVGNQSKMDLANQGPPFSGILINLLYVDNVPTVDGIFPGIRLSTGFALSDLKILSRRLRAVPRPSFYLMLLYDEATSRIVMFDTFRVSSGPASSSR